MNKKGFAISVVLYTMVILIIGIFYLLLGIVRNRYYVGSNLKQVVIDNMNLGSQQDIEPPICTFVSGPSVASINIDNTATYVLECTDESGLFSDSSITSSDLVLSSAGVVTVKNPTVTEITNGFRYTITVTGKKAGTTSLNLVEGSVVDNNGNANAVITSNSITVKSSSGSSTSSYPSIGGGAASYSGTSYSRKMYVNSDCAISYVEAKYYCDGVLIKTESPSLTQMSTNNYYFYISMNGAGRWSVSITAVDVAGKKRTATDTATLPSN